MTVIQSAAPSPEHSTDNTEYMSTPNTTLTDEQLHEYLETTREHGDKTDRFIVFTFAYSTIHIVEFSHMTADWFDAEEATLSVPPIEECDCQSCQTRMERVERSRAAAEQINDRLIDYSNHRRDAVQAAHDAVLHQEVTEAIESVQAARLKAKTAEAIQQSNPWWDLMIAAGETEAEKAIEEYDGIWQPVHRDDVRTVPIPATEAVDAIANWLEDHDRVTMSRSEIGDRLERLAEQSNLERPVDSHALRRTYQRRLVEMGFTVTELQLVSKFRDADHVHAFLKHQTPKLKRAFETRWEGL